MGKGQALKDERTAMTQTPAGRPRCPSSTLLSVTRNALRCARTNVRQKPTRTDLGRIGNLAPGLHAGFIQGARFLQKTRTLLAPSGTRLRVRNISQSRLRVSDN